MLPIPGTLSLDHLRENLAALEIELSDAEFERSRVATADARPPRSDAPAFAESATRQRMRPEQPPKRRGSAAHGLDRTGRGA